MSEERKDGGPAFPEAYKECFVGTEYIGGEKVESCKVETFYRQGMSLRDYFAGQALMGMLADHTGVPVVQRFAQLSYELADEMIKARERK